MAEIKYGQLESWDDGEVSLPNDFLRLIEGNNQVRVLTNPFQFVVHWVKDSSNVNRKIRCSIKGCPLCRKMEKPQYRWLIGVLDRKSGLPKILEISQQIYKGIKTYVSDPEWSEFYDHSWGKVIAFDFNIKRGPAKTNPLYEVVPSPKRRDLTDEEVSLVEAFFERVKIEKFTMPSTPEEVAEKMGAEMSAPVAQTRTASKEAGKPKVKDEDFDFGDNDK